MRVAYIISSYQTAAQINRLVATIQRSSSDPRFILGHDHHVGRLATSDLDPTIRLIGSPDGRIGWGTWAFMRIQLTGLGIALEESCDWAVTISAQDYPVLPLRRFEDRLSEGRTDALIEEFDDRANYPQLLKRYRRRIVGEAKRSAPLFGPRLVRRVLNRSRVLHVQDRARDQPPLLERPADPPLRGHERLRMGNNWWSLNARAAEKLLDRVEGDPALVDHFARTFIPSEAFPHTVLLNDPDLCSSTREPLQFTRWEGWSPRLLTAEDVPEAIASDRPFARKFEEDDPALDLIDEHLASR